MRMEAYMKEPGLKVIAIGEGCLYVLQDKNHEVWF
jgi:hypothetical protein